MITVEIYNSNSLSLEFTVNNFLTKLAIWGVLLFYTSIGGLVLYYDFSTGNLFLTILIILGLTIIL